MISNTPSKYTAQAKSVLAITSIENKPSTPLHGKPLVDNSIVLI